MSADRPLRKITAWKNTTEKLFFILVLFAALTAIVFLSGIIISIFSQSIQIFQHTGFWKFISGTAWHPDQDPAEYGILPLIIGTVTVTIIAMLIGIPLGVGSAVYIAELAKPREREFLKPVIELLAGIPSVIFGLFGMVYLAPFVASFFNLPTGMTALSAGIILGIMTVPIISSLSEDSLYSVPRSLREASLALGGNKWETIVNIVIPAAKSGIITSIILGFGRAVGETMVVLMVAGNSPVFPKNIFTPVRPMTSTIAAEMGEAPMGSMHVSALFGIGAVLFIITFTSVIVTEYIRSRIKKNTGNSI
ncbi:MAG TPA: phosphate ABC transporter permease subunit PstC [Spirochaetia bacterium]|nr:phosphate ABC transporter permease subunit PstC [Spirochaetia bacterium]